VQAVLFLAELDLLEVWVGMVDAVALAPVVVALADTQEQVVKVVQLAFYQV
jgi:hypothetical protein